MLKKLSVVGFIVSTALVAKMGCNAAELLQTTEFTGGVSLPWHISESEEKNSRSEVVKDHYVVHMEYPGKEKWDVQIRHREISIVAGESYTVQFSLKASKSCKIYAKIGDQGTPYYEAWNNKWKEFEVKANEVLEVKDTFVAEKGSVTAEFAFHIGGTLAASCPYDIEFISMSLDGKNFKPTAVPTPTPARNVRVNQLGYFAKASKTATLNLAEDGDVAPKKWELKDSSGKVVATGMTTHFGNDAASGQNVHTIDFSSYQTEGKDYMLYVGEEYSFPFDIGEDMYSQMKYDALKYYYHARSGIAIEMPYCVEKQWARAAGHTADKSIPCIAGRDWSGPALPDLTGGWYDAGDHGKYVVNGGISLWQLQNIYEHSMKKGVDDQFADGELNIPESKNGINDLLDETRWEMDWMMKMQIPAGASSRAGMAAHKMADEKWTALATRPDMDKEKRIYYPPSTAATLNLAACAAQAARIWEDIDSTFAAKCLKSAETAYAAAKANPAIFAPYGQELGSGTYGDNNATDDFHWAACELYLTTGDSAYLDDAKDYKDFAKMPTVLSGEANGTAGCFDWGATGGLGTLSLALVAPDEFPQAVESIREAADKFMEIQDNEGYGIPLAVSTYINEFGGVKETIENGYPWASNSFAVNEAIVMLYAYDSLKDSDIDAAAKYSAGALEAMDYLMGRNPMLQCYVTGYGENPTKYPHHRFFCPQSDPSFPSVPPGFLSGGPNSGCQDPWASGAGLKVLKIPPQRCYLDHVESWATNEVTINWNAPLSWITYYLDTFGPDMPPPNGGVSPSASPSSSPAGIVEDVNKDGSVNMQDVMLIAASFGTVKGDTRYSPKCDLNNDGAINMQDIIKLATKFGYTYKI